MKASPKINECDVSYLKKEHKPYDCLFWGMIVSIPIIIACVSIARNSVYWFVVYLAVFIISQILIYKFLCTHCPHYCKKSKKLQCMFLWNMLKIFKPKPGSWKLIDKIVIPVSIITICLFPIYWIWQDKLLFIIYIISGINFMLTLKKYECSRCIYFHCPMNSVTENKRKKFNAI